MSSDSEKHKDNISKHCRLCLNKTPSNKLRSISEPVKECINVVYNVDISEDDPYVHPSKMCNSCRSLLQRYIKIAEETEQEKCNVPALVPISPHSEDCEFCLFRVGQPMKRKKVPLVVDTALLKKRKLASTGQSSMHSGGVSALSSNQPSTSTGVSHGVPVAVRQVELSTSVIGIKPVFNINSLPLQQFTKDMQQVVAIFQCTVCGNVPLTPVQLSSASKCGHIFCKECFCNLLVLQYMVCPGCAEPLERVPVHLEGKLTSIHKNITVGCKYKYAGCNEHVSIGNLQEHIATCAFKDKAAIPLSRMFLPRPYKTLKEITGSHSKKRVSPIMEEVRQLCDIAGEDEGDVLFCMLYTHLKNLGDSRKEAVNNLWLEEELGALTTDDCLAMRVCNLQSKNRYREQYRFFQKCGINVLVNPNRVIEHEMTYMPGTARYKLEFSDTGEEYHHTPTKSTEKTTDSLYEDGERTTLQPIDTGDAYRFDFDRIQANCRGVRWSYADAMAKTLEELNVEIEEGMKLNKMDPKDTSVNFKVTVKDGADGLGSVSVYKERSEKHLLDNAFRYTFAIVQITTETESGVVNIYKPANPNSVKLNRPLLESIADENDSSAIALIMRPIEKERRQLSTAVIKVHMGSGVYRKFSFHFFFSMIDEKLARSEGGLMGSGSKFMCTLCDVSSPDEAKRRLGEFSINRTYQETLEIGQYVTDNPDKLSDQDLRSLSKGVNAVPLVKADAWEKGFDATHADINLARFFYKLLVREIAGVERWELTEAVKPTITEAAARFDAHVRLNLGVAPSLMMPGNYARQLFKEANAEVITTLLPNRRKRQKMKKVLEKMRAVRKMYRTLSPLTEFPEEVATLKQTAVEMGCILRDDFSYAQWPNYLHKVIEHCQEFIEDPRGPKTIGGMSGEGNEAGNRIFRMIRENVSSRGSTEGSLLDILKVHWLYSSPKLSSITTVERKQMKCSVCSRRGHNRATCPVLRAENQEMVDE